uniref:CDAN1-interacting nuclease 1 n=1 Tax=Salmo trutta TaxID=8032 RepID=A0A673Z080_SALTR
DLLFKPPVTPANPPLCVSRVFSPSKIPRHCLTGVWVFSLPLPACCNIYSPSFQCTINDCCYGPLVDCIKRLSPNKCPCFFISMIWSNAKMTVIAVDENQLLDQGKCTDLTILRPLCFLVSAVDGHIVHWIESKALFGHDHSHCTYPNKQFWIYWKRFGPGLVIYWHGFIEELDTQKDRGILLKDCFPSDIVTLCHGTSTVTTD